jgi:hypothetical protein
VLEQHGRNCRVTIDEGAIETVGKMSTADAYDNRAPLGQSGALSIGL